LSGMRQKLRFTAVLVVLLIILGTASYREQGKRQKLSFPESLDLVVVAGVGFFSTEGKSEILYGICAAACLFCMIVQTAMAV